LIASSTAAAAVGSAAAFDERLGGVFTALAFAHLGQIVLRGLCRRLLEIVGLALLPTLVVKLPRLS
jgi:hypothetical protein